MSHEAKVDQGGVVLTARQFDDLIGKVIQMSRHVYSSGATSGYLYSNFQITKAAYDYCMEKEQCDE